MPPPLAAAIAAPLIAGGASVLGQGINAYSGAKMNKRAERFAIKSYNTQRADMLKDWNMQNEYNSPSAAMQRLRQANLNPNLIYGNGQAVEMAAQPKTPDAPQTPNYRPLNVDLSGVGSAAMSYYDIKMKEAQVDNLRAQNTVITQDGLLKALDLIGKQTSNETAAFDLGLKRELKQVSVDAATTALENAIKQGRYTEAQTKSTLDSNERAAALQGSTLKAAAENVLNLRATRAKTYAEKDKIRQEIINLQKDQTLKEYEIMLNSKGIQKGDPLWQRAVANIVSRIRQPMQSYGQGVMSRTEQPRMGTSLESLGDQFKNFKKRY